MRLRSSCFVGLRFGAAGAASSVDIETAADAPNGVAGEATGEPAARHARVLARGARSSRR